MATLAQNAARIAAMHTPPAPPKRAWIATKPKPVAVATPVAAARPAPALSAVLVAPSQPVGAPTMASPSLASLLGFGVWEDALTAPIVAAGRTAVDAVQTPNTYAIDVEQLRGGSPLFPGILPSELAQRVYAAPSLVPLPEDRDDAPSSTSSSSEALAIVALAAIVFYAIGGK